MHVVEGMFAAKVFILVTINLNQNLRRLPGTIRFYLYTFKKPVGQIIWRGWRENVHTLGPPLHHASIAEIINMHTCTVAISLLRVKSTCKKISVLGHCCYVSLTHSQSTGLLIQLPIKHSYTERVRHCSLLISIGLKTRE